jgi:hypothetical protein
VSRWTIRLLKRIDPEERLLWAARLFWFSIVGGIVSTVFFAEGGFQRIVMAISWVAITVTCTDVTLTADVRDES